MIREASLSDFEAMSALEGQIFNLHYRAHPDFIRPRVEPLDRAYFEKCLSDEKMKLFVYEEDGEILGHCFTREWETKDHPMYVHIKILEIDDICVDGNERGKHIGQSLFSKAKAYAKEIGAAHLELTVWDFNKNARQFFEHMGMATRISRMEMKL